MIILTKYEGDSIFNEMIKIVIKNDHGSTIDFKVVLINKSVSNIYKVFCLKLKQVRGKFRAIKENEFKNYPKVDFEREKSLLLQCTIDESMDQVTLFDWKYMEINCFTGFNMKIKNDITKQLCYEFALQKLNPKTTVKSIFVIPWFYADLQYDDYFDGNDYVELHSRLEENELDVKKLNFSETLKIYLTHD